MELLWRNNTADGDVASLTVLLLYLLCAILPPSGRFRKKRWFYWKTLLHDSISSEDFEEIKYINWGAIEVQILIILPRCVTFSSSVSVQCWSHKCFVWNTIITTLLAFICMFYTKAYTVIYEAILSRKGIVSKVEQFYTEVFCFVIHF